MPPGLRSDEQIRCLRASLIGKLVQLEGDEMTTDSKTGDIGSVMKRGIAVLGLVAVVGLVEGCIIDTDPGPPAVCLDSSITFDWVITANGISRSCAQVG